MKFWKWESSKQNRNRPVTKVNKRRTSINVLLEYQSLEVRKLLAGQLYLPGSPLSPLGLIQPQGPTTFMTQVNTNASGQDIVGDAANEPSLCVDPTNRNRMAIGWRQFDTITNNFRQAGVSYTTDGGLTWTSSVLTPGNFRSDPVLEADANGNFYYSSLSSVTSAEIFKSTDGGATWGTPINAFGGDKQWIAIDRTTGPGRGNIYQHWNVQFSSVANTSFTRSTNGGASYDNPTTGPNPYSKWGTMDVAPDGALVIAGAALDTANGHLFAKSTNAQFSEDSPTFSTRTINLGGRTVTGAVNPVGLLGQVLVATDHSQNSTRGNIYVLGSVDPDGADPLDVMFIRSTDGGNTWSAPRKVNNNPAGQNSYQWFGTMSVAPNGRIDVIYNDTAVDPSNNFSVLKYAYSYDGGLHWAGNLAVTQSYNHTLGYPSQNKMGDYYDMVSDELGVNIAFSATFTGGQDVYFMRINALPSNLTPTLDALPNLTINEDAPQQFVALSGISAGEGETQALRVTATSSNTAIIPNPSVSYVSPNPQGSLSFTPVANRYGVVTVTVDVEDGGLDDNLNTTADNGKFSRSFTVTVNPVNDAPTMTSLGGDITYRENVVVARICNSAIVQDIDTPTFTNGTLQVSITAGGQAPDRLWITPAQYMVVSGNQLVFNNVVAATFSGGTNGQPLLVNFNNRATLNRVQYVLRNICFAYDGDDPSSAQRTLSIQLTDGAGGQASATKRVNVIPVNDRPVLTQIPTSSTYTLNAASILLAPAAVVADPDSPNFGGGQLSIRYTTGAEASNRLLLSGLFSFDASNNVLRNGTVIGQRNASGGIGVNNLLITLNANASKAIVQELLRSISFQTVSGVAKTARTLEISLSDGAGGTSSVVQTRIDVV